MKDNELLDYLSKEYQKGNLNQALDTLGYEVSFDLSEIATVMGITRERVRQLESSAIKKIRHPLVSKKLREYLSYSVEKHEGKDYGKETVRIS